MRKSILVMHFFILSFLFNGCVEDEYSLSLEDKIEIGKILNIKQPKSTLKCKTIPIYKEPKVQHCTKKMSKDECLMHMSTVSMHVRYQFRKQLRVCEAINKRQKGF